MSEQVMVSIICNAYNHEKYIRDALDGFVMQKTNFVYEILVHDDASTDTTADIIREYEAKYPELIKPIYQTENQYSKEEGLVGKIQRARALGKYIAICEGDDFWTDPLKLQKQVDALEAHPEIDMCTHRASKVKEYDKKFIAMVEPADHDTILTQAQVIKGGGGYLATCSLMFRRTLCENTPEFRKALWIDYSLQVQGALRGGIIYLNDNMSSYRVRLSNSWTCETMRDKEKKAEFFAKTIEMRKVLNRETGYIYDDIINEANSRTEFMLLSALGKRKELKKHPIYTTASIKLKIYLFIDRYFPVFIKLKHRLEGKV